MNEAPRLAEMLRAIATGNSVDWDAVDATASDESTSLLIDELKILSRIAEVHGNARRDADSRDGADEPSSSWGPLTILECVGRGSYGDVYRAWDTRLDREVALKVLRCRTAPDTSPVIEEGRQQARVRHPNAITVHGADRIDGRTGIWMEFIEGRTLEEELQTRGPLPAADVAAIGIDICRALEAVHKAGVVHGDIKAQNVMRDETGRIVLMDFGSGLSNESGDSVGGTPLYLAPEVLAGGPATVRSDVYAVGVLLYHVLTARYPVEGSTLAEVRARHGDRPPVSLRATRPDTPKRLCAVIERTLAFDPAARYDSARALETAIATAMKRPIATYATWAAATVAIAVIATAMSAALWRPTPGTAGSFAFKPRDLVLVTSFVNATNDPELDGVFEHALARELESSTHVTVAPHIRVEDMLRQIGKPTDASIDLALGREVCARDGGIPALIAGRAEKIGGTYRVSAEILGCADGRAVAAVTDEADDASALSGTIRRVASEVRARLGEERTAIQQSLLQHEKVPMPSLRALRLYTESFNLGVRQQWPRALERARQAVATDETFAGAHVWLAWAMRRNGLPRETAVAAADKAVQLSVADTGWERQWIRGSYFMLAGDDEQAEAAYRALVEVRPDHWWGNNNLMVLYRRRNLLDKVLPYAMKLADLRPYDPDSNFRVAQSILTETRDFSLARPYAMRTLQESAAAPPQAWTLFFDAAEHLAGRKIPQVEAVVMRNLQAIGGHPPAVRDAIRATAIRYLLTLGRARQARAVVEQFEDRGYYHPMYSAIVAFTLGDEASARSAIVKVPYNYYFIVTASLMARLGMIREAEAFLAAAPPGDAEGRDLMLGGSVAAARGDRSSSIPVLEQMAARRWPGNHARTLADLASAWLRRGERDKAINALRESWVRDPLLDVDGDGPYGHDWMPNALLLAELYRRAGRRPEAEPIEADLDRLLATADPDFPLFEKLKRLRATGYSAGPATP